MVIAVAKDKSDLKKKKLELSRLAWQILGCKFLYYRGAEYKIPASAIPSDTDYDKWEDEYRKLCKELKVKPTAADMVEFDETKPSCRMVMQHLIMTNGKCPVRSHQMRLKNQENPIQEARKETNTFYRELCSVLEEVGVKEKTAKKIRIKMKKRFNL